MTVYALHNPTKRLGIPHEVAKVVAFLVSEDASYINGQNIANDGFGKQELPLLYTAIYNYCYCRLWKNSN